MQDQSVQVTLIRLENSPCPHCDDRHALTFAQSYGRPELIAVCPHTEELVALTVDESIIGEVEG